MEPSKDRAALSALDKIALKNAVSATQALQREILAIQTRQNEIMTTTFRAIADAHALEVPEGANIVIGPSIEQAEMIKIEMPPPRQAPTPSGMPLSPKEMARRHAEQEEKKP